ncbi:MAG: hypothetical protein OEN56_05600 [Gemmatimonadota bacterium]|nr:hypothetical protein [Gemmatimonadota bacterium]
MQPQILVVSDPPHGAVDHATIAATLGLELENTKLKVAFAAPEVLAVSGPQAAHDVAKALQTAGMHVRVVPGSDLADLPWPRLCSSVDFADSALRVRIGGDDIDVPYSASVWGVSCLPPTGFSAEASVSLDEARASGPGAVVAEALEWTPHLDLFAEWGGSLHRLTITDDPPHVVEEVERLFHRVTIDRRMENVRPRRRFVAGEAGFDIDLRKAFSFGTLLLRQVLQSISEELRDLPQYEYAARLSYATRPR